MFFRLEVTLTSAAYHWKHLRDSTWSQPTLCFPGNFLLLSLECLFYTSFQETHLSMRWAQKQMWGAGGWGVTKTTGRSELVSWGLPACSTGDRLSWLRPQHPSSPHLLPLLQARRGWWCSLGIGALARRTWSGWDWMWVGESWGRRGGGRFRIS